mmetsp:Transcript_14057/g.37979  ORF Transcript_14057/g.37979 Transcript_14057/m.37979 type:complete len:207 (-) Transcript_14057:244-864(-)
MRERKLGKGCVAHALPACWQRCHDHRRQHHKAANLCRVVALCALRTLFRGHALGPVCKKVAVEGLCVGVVVASWRGHELHVLVQDVLWVIPSICCYAPHYHPGAQGIQRIFSSLHPLMVMHAVLAPKHMLAMVDHIPNNSSGLPPSAMPASVAEAHDAARVCGLGRLICGDFSKVANNVLRVVVPVHRHAERIRNEHPPQCSPDLV